MAAAQIVIAVAFAIDPKLAAGAIVAVLLVAFVLDYPVLGACLLIMARLMDAASNAFIKIGHTNIGYFEPALLLASFSVLVRILWRKQKLLVTWPYQVPLLLFMAFQTLSLTWSANQGDGLSEIISMVVVLANTFVLVSIIRTPRDFLLVIWSWILACVLIGFLTATTSALGMDSSVPWKAASGGGRETGLGQQPNWYAMNLMFIIHTCFGLAITARQRWLRWLLIGAGLFIFVSQMRSGSRGGTYALVIGGVVTALYLPVFRKWFLRFLLAMGGFFGLFLTVNFGSTTQAFARIWFNLDHGVSYVRGLNWTACYEMFVDTWGRGIGAGGYVDLLEIYNWHLYNSVYRYPHGISWGIMAHYGIVGFILLGWFLVVLWRMVMDLTKRTRGSTLEILAWTMPASMVSYFAWSFVEFEYNEKPFWEFLAVYTTLYLVVRRMTEAGEPLPPMPDHVRIPWRSSAPTPLPEVPAPTDPDPGSGTASPPPT